MKFEVVRTRISAYRMMRIGTATTMRKRRKMVLVKSRLRRLKRQWTIEPVQDIVCHHGIKLEAELAHLLTKAINEYQS